MLGHSRPARGPVQPAAGRTDCEWVLDPNPDLVHTKFGWAQAVQNSIFVCLDPKMFRPHPKHLGSGSMWSIAAWPSVLWFWAWFVTGVWVWVWVWVEVRVLVRARVRVHSKCPQKKKKKEKRKKRKQRKQRRQGWSFFKDKPT